MILYSLKNLQNFRFHYATQGAESGRIQTFIIPKILFSLFGRPEPVDPAFQSEGTRRSRIL